jgi:hypothetical protein
MAEEFSPDCQDAPDRADAVAALAAVQQELGLRIGRDDAMTGQLLGVMAVLIPLVAALMGASAQAVPWAAYPLAFSAVLLCAGVWSALVALLPYTQFRRWMLRLPRFIRPAFVNEDALEFSWEVLVAPLPDSSLFHTTSLLARLGAAKHRIPGDAVSAYRSDHLERARHRKKGVPRKPWTPAEDLYHKLAHQKMTSIRRQYVADAGANFAEDLTDYILFMAMSMEMKRKAREKSLVFVLLAMTVITATLVVYAAVPR